MRILVFGGSGRCGSWVLLQALERGLTVTAAVRPASSYSPPEGVLTQVGDPTDPEFVRKVIEGHDVVLSCLGIRRAGLLPWARLCSPPDLVQTFTRHLRKAAAEVQLDRIIWISAGGVSESRDQATGPIRAMIRAGNVAVAYDDLEAAESVVPVEDRRWLAVRPVTLVNGPPTGRAGEVTRYGLFAAIRRADVARWMLDVAVGTTPCESRAVLLGTVR